MKLKAWSETERNWNNYRSNSQICTLPETLISAVRRYTMRAAGYASGSMYTGRMLINIPECAQASCFSSAADLGSGRAYHLEIRQRRAPGRGTLHFQRSTEFLYGMM